HFLPAYCRLFDLDPDDRFSLLSGLGHDPLQREIFTSLYLGGTIVVPDPSAFAVSGRMAAWLGRQQVTVAHLTPTLGQLLTELPPDGMREPVTSLRRAILIGESLARQDVGRLRALAPGVSCVNLYGATETQRALAFHLVTPEEVDEMDERAHQVLPLGRGMPDAQLLVLNPAGGLAGLGELGEIAIRSPYLARGYLGNAELTAERFQVNPFAPSPGDPADRMYRTGDLGRYRADGEVVYAGRLDQQVKLRGFRIELGEIEGVLAGLSGVLEAVVVLRPDLPGGAGLVAYVRTEDEREGVLRGELQARLPAYMVPAVFVRLDTLPRNAHGKLDRRALAERPLPGVPATPGSIGVPGTAPRTAAEEILAGIFAAVLGLETVGAEADFFALGGHSLLATQLVSRVRAAFGVELSLRAVFEHPTVAALAREVETASRLGGVGGSAPPLVRVDRTADLPLSFAQQRLWFIDQLEGGSLYNIPIALRMSGELSVAVLSRVLGEVVRRHEVLRTVFPSAGGRPRQVILPPAAAVIPLVDLTALSPAVREP
ncbi:MAG TPA: AMP-binding protein, partial [Thermoanaerobaculia bacterium]